MKKVLLIFSLLSFHFSLVHAQDTTKPFIMSQSAYDSTLRALKHVNSLREDSMIQVHKTDSLKAAREKYLEDSIRTALQTKAKQDSINSAVVNDSLEKAQRRALVQYKRDSIKYHKDSVKYYRPKSTGYVALSYGICLPVSDYAAIASAASGANISVSADFPGTKSRFGWAFKFDYGWNGFNQPQYLHITSEYNGGGLTYTMSAPGHNYIYYTAMLGPCISLPKEKFSFDARMLFGALTGNMPATSVNVKDTLGNKVAVNKYQSVGHAFAFDFGIGIRYRVRPHLCVMFTFDYLIAQPSMEQVSNGFTYGPTGIVPLPAQTSVILQTFAVNNLNLGVGYTLGEKKRPKPL